VKPGADDEVADAEHADEPGRGRDPVDGVAPEEPLFDRVVLMDDPAEKRRRGEKHAQGDHGARLDASEPSETLERARPR
jgi:hypothetical protein